MITELKTFIIKCDGCGKTIKRKKVSPKFAVPKDWHTEKGMKRNFNGYPISTTTVESVLEDLLDNNDKHYCDGCYAIKDIIE